jgi:hypothetical protein
MLEPRISPNLLFPEFFSWIEENHCFQINSAKPEKWKRTSTGNWEKMDCPQELPKNNQK